MFHSTDFGDQRVIGILCSNWRDYYEAIGRYQNDGIVMNGLARPFRCSKQDGRERCTSWFIVEPDAHQRHWLDDCKPFARHQRSRALFLEGTRMPGPQRFC